MAIAKSPAGSHSGASSICPIAVRGCSPAGFVRALRQGPSILAKVERVSGATSCSGQLRVFTLNPDGQEATLYSLTRTRLHPRTELHLQRPALPGVVEASATRIVMIPGALFRSCSTPAIRNMTVQAFSTVVFRLMTE